MSHCPADRLINVVMEAASDGGWGSMNAVARPTRAGAQRGAGGRQGSCPGRLRHRDEQARRTPGARPAALGDHRGQAASRKRDASASTGPRPASPPPRRPIRRKQLAAYVVEDPDRAIRPVEFRYEGVDRRCPCARITGVGASAAMRPGGAGVALLLSDRRVGPFLLLLAGHRQPDPVFGADEVVVAVLAHLELHPVDGAGELAGGRVVVVADR